MRSYARRAGFASLVFLVVGIAAAASGAASAADWNGLRGPNQDGSLAGTGAFAGPTPGLAVDWSRELGSGYSGISVVGDLALTMFADGEFDCLVALDAASGAERWRFRIDPTYEGHDGSDDGPISTPVVDGETVYALGPRGRLVAVGLRDGAERWSVRLEELLEARAPRYGFATTPLVVGDVLFVQAGGPEGKAFAGLDKRTGQVRWSSGDATIAYQSPVLATLAGTRQIVAAGNRKVAGLDPADGSILWEREYNAEQDEGSTNPVVIEGDRILLVAGLDSVLLQVSQSDGVWKTDELWRSRALKGSVAAPVFREGHFYGFDGNFLTCVSAESGEKVWKSRPPGGHGLLLIDDRLVVYTPDGELVVAAASPEGYAEQVRLSLGEQGAWTWPSFAGGRVFVRNLTHIARVGVTDAPPPAAPVVAERRPPAHRFEAFVREVEASPVKRLVVDEFMNAQSRLPLVEEGYVHFIYRGAAEDVAVTGSMTEYQVEEALERIEGTDLFHRSYPIEPGARWEYRFNVDFENVGPDAANPRRVPGVQGDSSEVFAAGYRAPDFLAPYRGDRPGRVESFTLASEILGNEREITVYLPAGYDDGAGDYPVLLFTAGQYWRDMGGVVNTLNHLVGHSAAPLVAVFVADAAGAAQAELGGDRSVDYVRMLADELLPRLASSYRIADDAASRAVVGYATATLATARAVLERPEVFGKAAIESAYLLGTALEDLTRLAGESRGPGARFLVHWNRYEVYRQEWNVDLAADSKRLVEALRAAGRTVGGGEVRDAAGWGSWRARVGEIVEDFFPAR